MEGFLHEANGAYRLELREPIPWPRGGLTDRPMPYRQGALIQEAGGRPVTPGERALIDRLIGYLDELIVSAGGAPVGLDVALSAAPPKHALVRLEAEARLTAPDPAAVDRLRRRVSGLCCAPVIAYQEGELRWYQCANCARLFCPHCLAPDLCSEETDAGTWSLQCPRCHFRS